MNQEQRWAPWRAWTETLEAPGVPRLFRHGDVHRLDRPAEADLYLGPEGMFLRVRGEGVSVVHEEHAPIHPPARRLPRVAAARVRP